MCVFHFFIFRKGTFENSALERHGCQRQSSEVKYIHLFTEIDTWHRQGNPDVCLSLPCIWLLPAISQLLIITITMATKCFMILHQGILARKSTWVTSLPKYFECDNIYCWFLLKLSQDTLLQTMCIVESRHLSLCTREEEIE